MFGDDEPRNPSPRTTIVGGQPPRAAAEVPPVPTGIQRLLRLASVDDAFRGELLARRGGIAGVAKVELTASESAILHAIPAAQLEAMIASLPPPADDRRSFLRQTAATAVMLLGGAALSSSCRDADVRTVGGAAPDVPPPRPRQNLMQDEGGAAPDRPPPRPADGGAPREMAGATAEPPVRKMAGATADPKRQFAEPPPPRVDDDTRPMAGVTAPPRPDHRIQAPGGAAPDPPPPRPSSRPTATTGGAAPDRPGSRSK
jgi:hypothetical protein